VTGIMDKNSFFWKVVDGRLPPPACAKTLGIEIAAIDGERGTIEVNFEAKPEFLNPAGNVQGGFLAAMLDDTMGPALSATLDSGEFAPTVNLNVQFHRPAKAGPLNGWAVWCCAAGKSASLRANCFRTTRLSRPRPPRP
jgi:uncharacterized protein (TIGR00369 family)